MQRVPSVRDIDKAWAVQNAKANATKREGKGLINSASSTSLGGTGSSSSSSSSTAVGGTMKRTPSAEELKLDSNDEETQRLKEAINIDIDQVMRRWSDPKNINPIHDILSVQRLELYAHVLAEELQVTSTLSHGRALLPTLKANGSILLSMYSLLSAAILNKEAISPAAECFVDNWHIIEDQLAIVQQDLPKNYYYELPKLSLGVLRGYPRVYAISLIMVAYTDSLVDFDTLARFVQAYQRVCPLLIGELWAVAITLRIVLFEQLRLLAVRLGDTMTQLQRANKIADDLLLMVSKPSITASDIVHQLSSNLGPQQELQRTLIVQLAQRLRDQDPIIRPAFTWLESQLSERYHTTTANVVQMDHHAQAADQVTIQNIIGSMRMLNNINWIEFVEGASLVHQILCKDPAHVFDRMDFATRDQYRHAVERISKGSRSTSEFDVAQMVVDRSNELKKDDRGYRKNHIGYWLVGEGVAQLEKTVQYSPPISQTLHNIAKSYPTVIYLGALLLLTAVCMAPTLEYARSLGSLRSTWSWLFFAGLSLIPASELALCFLNHTITLLVKPKPLPSMNTEKGVPASARTMVVIPMLFTNTRQLGEILDNLEIHFLANQDEQLSFALLADYTDADTETTPNDRPLLTFALDRVAALNRRYGGERFFVFHRHRQWNASENRWMGWERKRGKIHEFNQMLRGVTNTSYVDVSAPLAFLQSIKYVITLDADTSLPRDAARRLIGVIIHPLNTPHFDPQAGVVTEGYGILQPRVSVDLASSFKSRFSQLYSNYIGIDAYHTSVSDVYQDLFGEGSFVGKGLYDVDAFLNATKDRVPENTILSHDLFEGLFVRSALVTEVELYDDHPSDWATFARRQHRWIRGDWQLLPWLLPRVPNEQRKFIPNKLSVIARFKMADNFRRSLVAPAQLLWLVLAWTLLPGSAWTWTGLVLLMFIFPAYAVFSSTLLQLYHQLMSQSHPVNLRMLASTTGEEVRIKVAQFVLNLSFLVEQAWDAVDAIGRTLYRQWWTHRNMLEWTTSAQVEQLMKSGQPRPKLSQRGPLFAMAVTVLIIVLHPFALPVALPFLLAWGVSPWTKVYLSGHSSTTPSLTGEQRATFRAYARRTWHFFEHFVTEEDHWLAPDNYQEDPNPVVAHRTSPTNIGLQMLATLSASDMSFIGHWQCLEMMERLFNTLSQLDRFNGHFFNWYDTSTGQPLLPKYISTVDSGNLAGHVLVVKQWCYEKLPVGVIPTSAKDGLIDTLVQLGRDIGRVRMVSITAGGVTITQLQDTVNAAVDLVRQCRATSLGEWEDFLLSHLSHLRDAEDVLNALCLDPTAAQQLTQCRQWMSLSLQQVIELQRDISLLQSVDNQRKWMERKAELADQCDEMFHVMDFKFLFDENRKLFCIGYNAADMRLDVYHYDMLASESRLASFIAIAKGDVSQDHWFRLGRQLTAVGGSQALISWTASMFEYLMPLLVMRSYENTLLHQTYHAVVHRQIEYGRIQSVPWGISEAGYNARDLQMSYQYGPFGVPGLGLKRGLSEDLVVSPYSTMLGAMVDPISALSNLKSLETLQAFSRFGFMESIDYTARRLPSKSTRYVLKSYMAHHQGMSLLSLDNVLHNCIMQQRFHSDPVVQATQLLLQERIPHNANLSLPRADEVRLEGTSYFFSSHPNPRVYTDPNLPTPRTQLLSNGKYSVMITSAGSGYSRCNGTAVNRWREDTTRDHWGGFFYIRDRTSNNIWSCGYQPVCTKPSEYEVTFAEDKVELVRVDDDIVTHTEIIVATTDNVELRRISLTNHSERERRLEVTSFQEVVLAPPNDDDAHTTFSNLFVQTEFDNVKGCLLATRRLRTPTKPQVWAFHVVVVEGDSIGSIQYETDRARFIGRGRSPASPFALHNQGQPLSNSVGSVLDPCFSLRRSVLVPAGATVRVTFSTGMTGSRDEAISFADKYQDPHLFTREAAMVWTQSQVQLRHLNIDTDKAHLYQRLAGRVLYSDSSLRPHGRLLSSNNRVQSNLWPYGISGDLPIILAGINDEQHMQMIRDVLHAHEYLRLKGVATDLVILNEHPPSYVQMLQDEIQRQISMSASSTLLDQKGGVYIRRSDIMSKEDVVLLKSIARVYLRADQGTLEEQTKRRPVEMILSPPLLAPAKTRRESRIPFLPAVPVLPMAELSRQLSRQSSASSELLSFNGLGGFTADGREYVISLLDDQWTPAPWINVLANANNFGCLVSESGSGYTWSVNSRENRITPWSNDPIQDTAGEAIYIRDEGTGEYWTPTPLPIRESEKYTIRHGQGYTTIEHSSHGIGQRLRVFIPNAENAFDADLKVTELSLTNTTSQPRHLSVTAYHELVLGIQRHLSGPTVVTEIDPTSKAVFATNPYNNEFNTRVAFADLVAEGEKSCTCDRTEFLGRNGSPNAPACMTGQKLSANSGAGLDPCAAFRVAFILAPGETRRIIVQLGEADTQANARKIMAQYHTAAAVDAAFTAVVAYWEEVLTTIEIKSPDPTFNMLVNRWLLYQTLSCRLWARSAFYQSGGAFGFRDQLQDVMALVYSQPQLTRDQLIRAAGRQFPEGDVQHWWHPPTGRGVRTHCSDDALFLPFVLSFYVSVTGDRSILEEKVPFIKGQLLQPGQEDSYALPTVDDSSSATILEHAIRVADRHLVGGAHNLPFIGSCDWNDGMNMVGHEGKGESVWLAWFLYLTLDRFSSLLDSCDKGKQAETYRGRMASLKVAIEEEAWDGEWYRRAFFDDGTPLGSAKNDECSIDSLAQTWAVLSGAGEPNRARQAMNSADHQLVSREAGLIKLFTPPFDKGTMNPGYIKGYVPGVRENGGQYTHAAVWMVMAFAELGEGDRAMELFGMLNPINHTANRAGVQRYKVEPYVMAADVYGRSPHVGRGGWTWYTGSSSWMYRAALEAILGFDLQAGKLKVHPRIPRGWSGFQLTFRRKASVLGTGGAVSIKGGTYRIHVTNASRTGGQATDEPAVYELDGQTLQTAEVTLPDDGEEHTIRITV